MATPKPSRRKCCKCGAALPAPTRGRPPKFCSTVCRRAAELEIRRINRRLEALEVKRDDLISAPASEWFPAATEAREKKRKVTALDGAIRLAENRLRELLTEPEDQ